jgi:F-type H+-transporting ATPase subunit epsilon
MTVLQPGELMVRKDGVESYLVVTGGFMEVLANKVTILADAAENSDEIDEQRALAAVEQAQERIRNRQSDVQLDEALSTLKRAQARVGVARKRRRTDRV